jgi:hypothetical protein
LHKGVVEETSRAEIKGVESGRDSEEEEIEQYSGSVSDEVEKYAPISNEDSDAHEATQDSRLLALEDALKSLFDISKVSPT